MGPVDRRLDEQMGREVGKAGLAVTGLCAGRKGGKLS